MARFLAGWLAGVLTFAGVLMVVGVLAERAERDRPTPDYHDGDHDTQGGST